jgi:hypothetical protein
MKPLSHLPRAHAKRRARARRSSDGAVMFVVTTTLGVLAVMGVYALTSATQDIHAAGNMKVAMQAQQVSDFAAVAVADYVTYQNADNIINTRMLNPNATDPNASDHKCLSTQRNVAGTAGSDRAKSCVRISAAELVKSWGNREAFTSQSFGDPLIVSDAYIELTNPTPAPAPPGYDVNLRLKFAMLTVTTYGIVQHSATTNAETMQVGRGRFIVGPINQ